MKADIKVPQAREAAERMFGATLAMMDLEQVFLHTSEMVTLSSSMP